MRRRRQKDWNDQAVPYIRKVAAKCIWRVESLGFTEEDFLHEAYFIYAKCRDRAGTVLGEDGKLSPLFKAYLNNFLIDLSNEATKKTSYLQESFGLETLGLDAYRHASNEGYFQILLSEAPKEVMEVISLVFNTPSEIMEEVLFSISKKHSKGFRSNAFLCKTLGYNKFKKNLVKITESYFSEQC